MKVQEKKIAITLCRENLHKVGELGSYCSTSFLDMLSHSNKGTTCVGLDTHRFLLRWSHEDLWNAHHKCMAGLCNPQCFIKCKNFIITLVSSESFWNRSFFPPYDTNFWEVLTWISQLNKAFNQLRFYRSIMIKQHGLYQYHIPNK